MTKKKRVSQEITAIAEPIITEAPPATNIRATLEEIRRWDGVIGYILRNSTSAAIDLKDPSKIIDYAILSSSALGAGDELSKIFNLGEVKNVIVEGEDVKLISLTLKENKVSIFLEKNADSSKILKTLQQA